MTYSLAIVVPAYNEAQVIDDFHARIAAVLDGLDADARVIYIDDGSRDETWPLIERIAQADARVVALRLSRNFGKEAAMTAGLDAADADAVVVIDADLQDPPELIPTLIARWREGFDVVYATRGERDGETRFKKFTSAAFYRVMERVADTPLPRDTGDFRLLSRRAVEALHGLRERQRFMKGLFAWIGYRQTSVVYHRDARHAGTTKWNYWRLGNLAVEGITSFSTAPLRIATWLGVSAAGLAFLYGVWVLLKVCIWGDPVRGYPTLLVVILFLGGAQLLALGVIGEYIGRTYAESKRRPIYYVESRRGAPSSPDRYPRPRAPGVD
ncbi:MAG: glycosyltransferase family 2 protein [Luteibacter sp.]|uniref:glycosyltransferase family 2 protein n=1 Tax=Luteibacter TaxID=242605 RepID=UPI000690412C|nr:MULTISPECIES: glycosyltransferase family 2 protein [unclassified Luteibacter]MDQ7996461.1 glycosyltransferase family 2 protein [Luteibacter sp.]MDQ8047911.1 glycosyltransferase family 2 protein [Luteibacter sp.]MDR6642645.1 glycosyltransferase involved in cell wall biosynthesis [Luteibacter sp. 1214]